MLGPRSAARQRRLYAISVAIALLGLGAGLAIWLFAPEVPPEGVSYVVVGGEVQAVAPGESKAYVREIERFGGKGALLLDELDRWFAALWRGPALGLTVGLLGTLVALALALFAYDMPNHPGTED